MELPMAQGNQVMLSRPTIPWSLQQIHQNSHHIASSATQHIHDLHDYVVQGLSPLINTPSLRPIRNGSINTNWYHDLNVIESVNNHQRSIPSLENGTLPMSYVIDIDTEENVFEQAPSNESPSESYVSNQEPDVNNRINDNDQGGTALRNSPEMHALLAFAEKYLPFVLILSLKMMFDHRIGILVNIGLFITFFHANTVVKREIAQQAKRKLRSLFLVIINLITSIFVIYAILADSNLAYALIFIPPYSAPVSFWEVLWIVSITDYVLRLLTIIIKLVFVAVPAKLIAFQKKGKYYLFIERTSQLYRSLSPMQHWLYFFSESYSGPSKVFGVILSATYLIFKCKRVLFKAKVWKKAFLKMMHSKTYGTTPSSNQIKEAGDSCPICQDDYKSPSMLQCKHIFCEECVALWFDRERTCPICRAQIADDPAWRDGSTTLMHQIF